MDRSALIELREQVQASLKRQGVMAAAISEKNVISQAITIKCEDERYDVPVDIFQKHDIEYIAKRVKEAHGMTQK